MIALWLAMAAAGEEATPQVRLALRGVAEQWSDVAISSTYTGGAPLGALGVDVPLTGPLWLDVEVGYRRLGSATDEALSLELVPASVLVEWSPGTSTARPFVAAGPALTAFHERYAPDSSGVGATTGARLAGELRLGLRIETGLITPRRPPAPSPVKGVAVELYAGRRQARPIGGRTGFDLGAWRASLGLSLAL